MNLILDLAPMPCPRPRIAVRGRFPVAYYPKPYADWKVAAASAIKKAAGKGFAPYSAPVAVAACFNVKRPKSTKLKAPKPDIDNYLKSLLDALTAAEVWTDDSLVVRVDVRKRWAAEASISVTIALEYIT